MNVLFVFPNIQDVHHICYPYGLASLVSMTLRHNHNVRVLAIRNKNDYKKIQTEVIEFKPKVVGFSSVSSQFRYVKEMAALVKKLSPQTITVCGGIHATVFPQCILETEFLDGVFVGESEYAFIDFLHRVKCGLPYNNVDNFTYSKGNDVVHNKLKPLIKNLDELPYPDKILFPYDLDFEQGAAAEFYFSRGCPFTCSYCSNHAIANRYGLSTNKVRYRSPESCIGEIEEVLQMFPAAQHVRIFDDTFGLDKSWCRKFLKKYKQRIKLKFSCQSNPLVIDEELVSMLKETGCFRIRIGVESGNEYIRRKIMNRNIPEEGILRAFELTHQQQMETFAYNIVGIPGETIETLNDTVRINRKLKPTITFAQIFHPYRGTRLGDYCFENNLVDFDALASLVYERRDSVLKFSKSFKQTLRFYRDNWWNLIYNYNLIKNGKNEVVIDTTKMVPLGGFGYTCELPLSSSEGDLPERRWNSIYSLFEDDQELFPKHTHPRLISTCGKGAYSHWENTLHFSASDNSDPRQNKRNYILKHIQLPRIA